MKTASDCLIACVAASTLLGSVEAQHCGTPVRAVVSSGYGHQVVVKKDVVVEKVITPVINQYALVLPVAVFPAYGAVYQPAPYVPAVGAPPATQPPPVQSDQMRILMDMMKANTEALKAIDARLQKLEGTQPGAQPKPKDPFNPQNLKSQSKAEKAAKVVARACVNCHDVASAAEKGGNFVMVDGDGYMAQTTAQQGGKVAKRIDKDMPPKDSGLVLSESEKADLKAHYGE